MFLIDVISRVRTVRITSALSRMASVVSLNDEAQSTTVSSWRDRSTSMTRLIAAGVTSSAISGEGGASRTLTPDEWAMTKVSSDSGSPPESSSGTRSAIDLLFGFRFRRTPDVAELERAVEQADALASIRRRRDGRVDRDRGAAHPALRAEDRHDLARLLGAGRGGHGLGGRHDGCGDPALLLSLAGVDLADRCRELVGAERLHEELAGAGQHRPAEVVGLTLHGHHHDRRRRHPAGHQLGGGDPVHLGHVDVHQDDVRQEARGDLQCLGAGCRGPDDRDVAFEAEQLAEVIPGLRDVIDDQNADLVAHPGRRRTGSFLASCRADGWTGWRGRGGPGERAA